MSVHTAGDDMDAALPGQREPTAADSPAPAPRIGVRGLASSARNGASAAVMFRVRAERDPDAIVRVWVDPAVGIQRFQAQYIADRLGFEGDLAKQAIRFIISLYRAYEATDASIAEINPLARTEDGRLVALDAKFNIDDNALYRQEEIGKMRDLHEEDALEVEASEHSLNYIKLDGNVGCMVNGAGLAMATMDIEKLAGGEPANFLDVGGGATKERVAEAFKLILSDDSVKAVLVNIFGGIVRCDMIAEGIIGAVEQVGVNVPVVVRLEGNNAELGAEKLASSGLNIIAATSLTDAAQQVVKAAEGK